MPLSTRVDDTFRRTPDSSDLPAAFKAICTDNWQVCGEGVFSWSVFKFYRARLLTTSGVFNESQPFLLDLHYLRSLAGQQIVSTSVDEIARLFTVSETQKKNWAASLAAMMPDVSLGDRLLGWFVPGVQAQFFSATQHLGQVDDPEFVRMFSAIWLDPRTRSPQLRAALLGSSQDPRQTSHDSQVTASVASRPRA